VCSSDGGSQSLFIVCNNIKDISINIIMYPLIFVSMTCEPELRSSQLDHGPKAKVNYFLVSLII
jgi:hypothetical protein